MLRYVWSRPLQRLLIRSGPLLLLLALVPSVLYIDHWAEEHSPIDLGAVNRHSGHIDFHSHQAHCHYGPASCSQQAIVTNYDGTPRLIEEPAPALVSTPVVLSTTHLSEFVSDIPTEPPKL